MTFAGSTHRLAMWRKPSDWFYRKIADASFFARWHERREIVLGDPLKRPPRIRTGKDYLGEAVFPATEFRKKHFPEESISVGTKSTLRVVLSEHGRDSDRKAANRFFELCEKRGWKIHILSEKSLRELKSDEGILCLGRVFDIPLLRRLGIFHLYGYPDGSLPEKNQSYISFLNNPVSGKPRFLVAAAGDGAETALAQALVKKILVRGKNLTVSPCHEVRSQSENLKWSLDWPGLVYYWQTELRQPLPTLPRRSSPERIAAYFAQTLRSGTPSQNFYNNQLIQCMVEASRYFARSSDLRALRFFRAALFEIAHYFLDSKSCASYPADFDFYIGLVITEYERWEALGFFSPEDRRFFRSVLLACARIAYRYYCVMYDMKNPTVRKHIRTEPPHNHQTFKARTLFLSGRYFSRFGISDAKVWLRDAHRVFSSRHFKNGKLRENAGIYEWIAYEQAAAYSMALHGDLRFPGAENLRMVADRQLITADNNGFPVDYGDGSVSFSAEGSASVARYLVINDSDSLFAPLLSHIDGLDKAFIDNPALTTTIGFRKPMSDPVLKQTNGWEIAGLDISVANRCIPSSKRKNTFDKAAFRTGWSPKDYYLLLEGFGNATFNHAHNAILAIERLNQDGHIWLVSNGYGKNPTQKNASLAFATRQLGPCGHNMLVLGEGRCIPPLFATMEHVQSTKRFSALSTKISKYNGCEWRRSIVITSGITIVLDDVSGLRPNAPAWLEWNILGNIGTPEKNLLTSRQGKHSMTMWFSGHTLLSVTKLDCGEWAHALKNSRNTPKADAPNNIRLYVSSEHTKARIWSIFSTQNFSASIRKGDLILNRAERIHVDQKGKAHCKSL